MTFETRFPSLKERHSMRVLDKPNWTHLPGLHFHQADIQEFCLDKARVKQAIEKIQPSKQEPHWWHGMPPESFFIEQEVAERICVFMKHMLGLITDEEKLTLLLRITSDRNCPLCEGRVGESAIKHLKEYHKTELGLE